MNIGDNMRIQTTSTVATTPGTIAKAAKPEEAGAQISDNVSLGNDESKPGILGRMKNWVKENITGVDERKAYQAQKHFDKNLPAYAGIGAAAGGAIGAGVGLYAGMESVKTDEAQLVWRQHDIKDPHQTGFSHSAIEDYHYNEWQEYKGTDEDGNAQYETHREKVHDGWWHNYSPNIEYTKVGTYETPEYQHKNSLTPITGGLAGLAAGAATGGLLGVAVAFIQKLIEERR